MKHDQVGNNNGNNYSNIETPADIVKPFLFSYKTSNTIENVVISYFAYVHMMYYFKSKCGINKTTVLVNQQLKL